MRLWQPHFDGKRFANYQGEQAQNILFHSIYLYINSLFSKFDKKWFRRWSVAPRVARRMQRKNRPCLDITFLGHATMLLQYGPLSIITDPVFGDISYGLYPRLVPFPLQLNQMPPIDVIFLSHNHYDHLDEASIQCLCALNPHALILVPQGNKAWLEAKGYQNIKEYTWWEAFSLTLHGIELRGMFTPAFHWSQRSVFDRNASLWGSWLFEFPPYTLYFAGDTAYYSHFQAIAREVQKIDIAFLPVGPCEPQEWMYLSHMGPEEAGQALLDLNATHFIPMHWGTYNFGADEPLLPIRRLNAWWNKNKRILRDRRLTTLKFGQTWML